jgi:general stress protein YciG
MPGTVRGGKQAADTNKKKYGKDFYARIGAMGGKKGTTGGFAANRDLARTAGAKGGRISRRRKAAEVAAQAVTEEVVTTTQNDLELAA